MVAGNKADVLLDQAYPFGDKRTNRNAAILTPEDLCLYNDLRDNRIREGLRLEQEHPGFGWVRERIDQLLQ